nr:MAG TPA: Exonuclease [Caudoviricetes sp.]
MKPINQNQFLQQQKEKENSKINLFNQPHASSNLGDRSKYIGGSDIPVILNISPWKKRENLLKEKVLGIHHNFKSSATEFGHQKELELIEFDALSNGYDLEPNSLLTQEFNNFDFPLIAHLDGIGVKDGDRFIIECKTSSTPFNGLLPSYYNAQVQFYMWQTGIHRTRIVFGQRLKQEDDSFKIGSTEEFYINYDEDYVNSVISPALVSFIDEIKQIKSEISSGASPESFFKDSSFNLQEIFGEETIFDITETIFLIDSLNKKLDEFKKNMLSKMQEKNIKSGLLGAFKVSRVESSIRETIDTKSFKQQMPDIAKQFIKTTKTQESIRITK